MKPIIQLKRVYDDINKADGYRILIDRLWPRGLKKETANIDEWAKELAPTAELRKWFDHDPEKWPEFEKRYRGELKNNAAIPTFLKKHAQTKKITLLFAAKDESHSNAVVLQQFLKQHFK